MITALRIDLARVTSVKMVGMAKIVSSDLEKYPYNSYKSSYVVTRGSK